MASVGGDEEPPPPHEAGEDDEPPTDIEISAAVRHELVLDDAVFSNDINIETNQGIVTLTGDVPNLLAKRAAVRRAEMVRGVRSVVDRLDVEPSFERSDELIQADVNNALLFDPATDSYQIETTVADGVVTLLGSVSSWAERDLAENVVASVRGVRRIDNQLDIDSTDPRPDADIQAEVRGRLAADRWIADGALQVQVNDGEVNVSGAVSSAAERSRVYRKAWVAGVEEVDVSDVDILPWPTHGQRRDPAETEMTDAQIARAVRDAMLYDPRVLSFNPDVQVEDGVVTLTGTVDSVAAKRAAGDAARNTTGVWRVRNLLTVRPEEPVGDELVRERAGTVLSWNPYVERHEIRIVSIDGRVYLYGDVDTPFERDEAERAVATVGGVTSVENHLSIRDGVEAERPDWAIEQDIVSQMYWDPWVFSGSVNVEVDNGVARLSGTVDDWRAYTSAIDDAYEAGADQVVDHLVIDGAPDSFFD